MRFVERALWDRLGGLIFGGSARVEVNAPATKAKPRLSADGVSAIASTSKATANAKQAGRIC